MSNPEFKNTEYKANNGSGKDSKELEVQKIPESLKYLQKETGISDEHANKLLKTYKEESSKADTPLLL